MIPFLSLSLLPDFRSFPSVNSPTFLETPIPLLPLRLIQPISTIWSGEIFEEPSSVAASPPAAGQPSWYVVVVVDTRFQFLLMAIVAFRL